jgi:hypothetical protein
VPSTMLNESAIVVLIIPLLPEDSRIDARSLAASHRKKRAIIACAGR